MLGSPASTNIFAFVVVPSRNLFLRSGVPLVPSQRCQSSGISFKSPVYGHIVPTGTDRLLDCEISYLPIAISVEWNPVIFP